MTMKTSAALILLMLASPVAALAQETVPAGEAFVQPLQQRDTMLIADQFRYGVIIDGLVRGDVISLPELERVFNDTLVLVRGWQLDTLGGGRGLFARKGGEGKLKIRADMVLSPFEEGDYHLPDIPVLRGRDGAVDTLIFAGRTLTVKTVPVDTATFEIHDLKGQMRYPLTLREVLPYVAWFQLAAVLGILVWGLVRMRRRRDEAAAPHEPPYITALKSLDKYRGDKWWTPDRQKAMYSGITDTLRTYMESRFGINAEEMTTAEIFKALKGDKDIPADMLDGVRNLFELADFVKFAKHTASEEDNARAVPTAASFVTSTYQSQLDRQAAEEGGDDK